MLDNSREIVEFVKGCSASEFARDKMRAFVCLRYLEIVGEAAGRVSLEFRESHDAIAWRPIIALQNRLIHAYAYADVDLNVIWQSIDRDIPILISELEKILGDGGNNPD